MACNCTTDRVAHIQGKCNDLSSTQIPHLDFEHEGYVMDLGVGSGDYIDFYLCLDCGKILNFTPISDEEIKASDEWEQVKGTKEEQEAEAALVAAEPAVFSMKEIEYRRINQLMNDAFGYSWRWSAEAREVLETTLETDDCSPALREAVLYAISEIVANQPGNKS